MQLATRKVTVNLRYEINLVSKVNSINLQNVVELQRMDSSKEQLPELHSITDF